MNFIATLVGGGGKRETDRQYKHGMITMRETNKTEPPTMESAEIRLQRTYESRTRWKRASLYILSKE